MQVNLEQSRKKFNPRLFAAAFGLSVTASAGPDDLVARRGDLSVFSAFHSMYPEVYGMNVWVHSMKSSLNLHFTCQFFFGACAKKNVLH